MSTSSRGSPPWAPRSRRRLQPRGSAIATPPAPAYEALQFNVRPGRLFADIGLRKALQLCIDLPRDVDAATGGTGIPVYGPMTPGTWADDPTLPRPARDTVAARRLIEADGWRPGTDGVYAKDGVRLATEILIRADDATRVKIADLIAHQARDCGMDIRSHPTKWDEIGATFFQYPYLVPGTKTPFDIYIGAFGGPTDPANRLSVLASSSINDTPGAYGDNYIGFSDPALDRLLTAANSTYDQATRARLYREAQQEVAAKLPYLYLYAYSGYDVLRAGLATADGPLDLDVPNWTWQPERLVVRRGRSDAVDDGLSRSRPALRRSAGGRLRHGVHACPVAALVVGRPRRDDAGRDRRHEPRGGDPHVYGHRALGQPLAGHRRHAPDRLGRASPGYALYGFRSALQYLDPHQLNLGSVVYGGLYWYDASFGAIPDLADGPCVPQGDGTVIRCRLIETTFQDGTPVTADDVAYSYRLFLHPAGSMATRPRGRAGRGPADGRLRPLVRRPVVLLDGPRHPGPPAPRRGVRVLGVRHRDEGSHGGGPREARRRHRRRDRPGPTGLHAAPRRGRLHARQDRRPPVPRGLLARRDVRHVRLGR